MGLSKRSSLAHHVEGPARALLDAEPASLAVIGGDAVAAIHPTHGHVRAEDVAVVAADAAPASEAAGHLGGRGLLVESPHGLDEGPEPLVRRPLPPPRPADAVEVVDVYLGGPH